MKSNSTLGPTSDRFARQPLTQHIQLIEGRVTQGECTCSICAVLDRDFDTDEVSEMLFQGHNICIARRASRGPSLFPHASLVCWFPPFRLLSQPLNLTNRQTFIDDLARKLRRSLNSYERTRMAHPQLPTAHRLEDRGRKIEQSH